LSLKNWKTTLLLFFFFPELSEIRIINFLSVMLFKTFCENAFTFSVNFFCWSQGGLTATDVFAVEWIQRGVIHFGMTVSYFGFVSDGKS
jgi:hypothetical protein